MQKRREESHAVGVPWGMMDQLKKEGYFIKNKSQVESHVGMMDQVRGEEVIDANEARREPCRRSTLGRIDRSGVEPDPKFAHGFNTKASGIPPYDDPQGLPIALPWL